MRFQFKFFVAATLLSITSLGQGAEVAGTAKPPAPGRSVLPPGIFAKVGDIAITQLEFKAAFDAAARGKFYHGAPPENEIAALQRQVGDQLVGRVLLLSEAKRRGLRADAAAVKKTVQGYEDRYAGSAQWKKNRDQALPPLIERLEQEDVLRQLENTVRASGKLDEGQVKAYYAAHQDQFTEPEQLRVAVILLKVDPSSTSETWAKADDQAKALSKRARAGEDFSALARQYSADGSAPQGGDMGYLHRGMLPDGTQTVLAKLKNGEISDSLRLLEGFAVFRLTDRKSSKLHRFEDVKVRAQELAQREKSNRAWADFDAALKSKASIQIDQSLFLPLAQ